jgi:hypothetical protein
MSARSAARRPWQLLLAPLLAPLLGLSLLAPAAADWSARLSAGAVLADQPVQLTLTRTGPPGPEPDLTPLEADFHIVDRSTSNEVRTINGRSEERRELRLTLLPRRSGTLTVPAIRAGDETTEPMSLRVAATRTGDSRLLSAPSGTAPARSNAAPAPASITLEVEAEPKRVRVQQQILLIARVRAAEAPPVGNLREPVIEHARVLPLGEQRLPDEQSGESESGGGHVYERRFAVFPTEPGRLRIPPLRFEAWRLEGGAPRVIESDALAIQVDPVPSSLHGRRWLPAAALSLTEAGPSAVRLAPGQALERMVTLRAEGLMAQDLPAIPMSIPQTLRIRTDAPRLWNERTPDGVIGYRTERVLVGSAEEGAFTVDGARIDWWSTVSQRWEQAQLPSWTLTVEPFASEHRRAAATWERTLTPESTSAGGPDTEPDGAGDGEPAGGAPWASARPWLYVAGGILMLALIRLLARGRRRAAPEESAGAGSTKGPGAAAAAAQPDSEETPDPLGDATREVERAYRAGDATAARSALLAWAAVVWPQARPSNLAQLALRLEPPLRDHVRLLEKAFFSPTPLDWRRPGMREQLEQAARPHRDTSERTEA